MDALIEAENAYAEMSECFVKAYAYEKKLRRDVRVMVKIRKNLEGGVADCLQELKKYKKYKDKMKRIGE